MMSSKHCMTSHLQLSSRTSLEEDWSLNPPYHPKRRREEEQKVMEDGRENKRRKLWKESERYDGAMESYNSSFMEDKTGNSVALVLRKDLNPGGRNLKHWHASQTKEQLGSNGNWPAK